MDEMAFDNSVSEIPLVFRFFLKFILVSFDQDFYPFMEYFLLLCYLVEDIFRFLADLLNFVIQFFMLLLHNFYNFIFKKGKLRNEWHNLLFYVLNLWIKLSYFLLEFTFDIVYKDDIILTHSLEVFNLLL